MGIGSNTTVILSPSVINGVSIHNSTTQTFIQLIGVASSSATAVNTDVAITDQIIPYKIICGASDQKLYLLVSGVWTLKATQSTRLPTTACQPIVSSFTSNSDENWADGIFMELVNLTN
jgi:hypothetical protein